MNVKSRQEFNRFLNQYKSVAQAARAVGVSRQLLQAIRDDESRTISPRLALAMENATSGEIKKEILVFGDTAQVASG